MNECPRCGETVTRQTVLCPRCRTSLKAFGHPGMPLHRATDNAYLCDSCTYHADDSCTYPQRPFARECILYHNSAMQTLADEASKPGIAQTWFQRLRYNSHWIALAGLILVSLGLALIAS